MTETITDNLKNLIRLFDGAKQGQKNAQPLMVYKTILAQIDALQKQYGRIDVLSKAKAELETSENVFRTWTNMGYQNNFVLTKRLLQSVALKIQTFAEGVDRQVAA